MSNNNGVDDKWQQIIEAVPAPLNSHFSGSSAVMGNDGLIVYLPSPTANTKQIEKQIEPRYILPRVLELFGDIPINYQISLPAMPAPKERIRIIDRRKKQPFFMVENLVYRDGHAARMKPAALSIYLCLVMHSDKDSKCWPSYATLGKLCGMSRRSAQSHIKRLRDLGYIEIETSFLDNGAQTSNTIFILEYPNI